MTDQYRISDNGEVEIQPLTWDGEPLYSPDTVREHLFQVEAFEQLRGQTTMVIEGKCERCGATGAQPHNAKPCHCNEAL